MAARKQQSFDDYKRPLKANYDVDEGESYEN